MSKLPQPAKLAVLFAVVAAVAFGGYTALIKPQRAKAGDLATQIDDARTQLEQLQSSGPEEESQPIRIADLFRLSRSMPDKSDIPNVLLQLSSIAAETGVTFQAITPHEPELVGGYRRIPIELVFQGHFYDLSDFLYRLRNLVGVHDGELDAAGRLFAVESVSFGEGEQQFPQVMASLTVSAYAFGDGTQAPLPATAAAPQVATETPADAPSDGGEDPIPPVPDSLSPGT